MANRQNLVTHPPLLEAPAQPPLEIHCKKFPINFLGKAVGKAIFLLIDIFHGSCPNLLPDAQIRALEVPVCSFYR